MFNSFLAWVSENVWIVSIVTAFLGAYLKGLYDRNKDLYIKIAEQKSESYSQYLQRLINLNGNVDVDFFYAKTQVIQYGSDEVLEKLAKVEYEGITNLWNDTDKQKILADLIIAMKKDVANPETKVTSNEILEEQIYKILNLKKKYENEESKKL